MDDPEDIFQWRRLDAHTTTSGQPREDQLAALRDLGVRHVVNLGLHSHEKALPDEAASVAALGMRYVHIPVDFDRPTESDYARFIATMTALAGETVHVHCIANLRVSAFFYRYWREMLGVDEAAARRMLEDEWQPGGVWAEFIGDDDAVGSPHRYAGRDY